MSVALQARVDAAGKRSSAFHAAHEEHQVAAVQAALDAAVLTPLASPPLRDAVATARLAPRLREHAVDLGDETATVWRSPVGDSVTVALPLDAAELNKSVARVLREYSIDGVTALDLQSQNLAPSAARSILTSLVALLSEWVGPNSRPGPVEGLRAGIAMPADGLLPKHFLSYGLTKNMRGGAHQLIHLGFDRESRAFQPQRQNAPALSQAAQRTALVAPYREMLEDLVFQSLLAGGIARLSWHAQLHWNCALISVTDSNMNWYHDDDLRVSANEGRTVDWNAVRAAAPANVASALADPSARIGDRIAVARWLGAKESSLRADAIAAVRDLGAAFPHLQIQHREKSGENPCLFSINVARPWQEKKTEEQFSAEIQRSVDAMFGFSSGGGA